MQEHRGNHIVKQPGHRGCNAIRHRGDGQKHEIGSASNDRCAKATIVKMHNCIWVSMINNFGHVPPSSQLFTPSTAWNSQKESPSHEKKGTHHKKAPVKKNKRMQYARTPTNKYLFVLLAMSLFAAGTHESQQDITVRASRHPSHTIGPHLPPKKNKLGLIIKKTIDMK